MSEVQTSLKEHRIVLLLVGLVGSGKSTFAQALEHHLPQFSRCNQDDLGDRRKVEALARRCLREGLSVCIDRTNFDAQQRATWINIAHEVPGTLIWVIVFDTPYEVCAERLRHRTDHPTIKTVEDGLTILARFRSQYRPPPPSPEYTREDILAILQRVCDAPSPSPTPNSSMRGYRPQGSGGFRARGNSFRGPSGPRFGRGSHMPYSRLGEGSSAPQAHPSNRRHDYDRGHRIEDDARGSWRSSG